MGTSSPARLPGAFEDSMAECFLKAFGAGAAAEVIGISRTCPYLPSTQRFFERVAALVAERSGGF